MNRRVSLEPPRRVSIRDVARESGASITTVSLVLNKASLAQRLAPQTRRRVEEVAQRLGYTADPVAKSLRTRQSHTVGIMIFDITDPYCTRLLKGIEASLIQTSYLPLIMSMQNEINLVRRYWTLMIERRIEGILVVANWPSVDINAFQAFDPRACVMIGTKPPPDTDISYVTVDNVDGGAKAMAHLYQLGHRKIAVLRGPRNIEDSGQRWQGIQQAANHAGIKLDSRLCPEMNILPSLPAVFYISWTS